MKENREENAIYASLFCTAIRQLASKPENINNFETYLQYHFDKWLNTYANTKEGITEELRHFAEMEIYK